MKDVVSIWNKDKNTVVIISNYVIYVELVMDLVISFCFLKSFLKAFKKLEIKQPEFNHQIRQVNLRTKQDKFYIKLTEE